jgi:transposase
MKYVGIDVHKKMCQAAVLDGNGMLLYETRFTNTLEGIEEFSQGLSAYRDEVKAVVELLHDNVEYPQLHSS